MSVSGYLSTSDVSNLLGISVEDVVWLAREGRIPCVRDGEAWYIPRADIRTWIADTGKLARPDERVSHSRVAPLFSIVDSTDMDHYRAQPGNWNTRVTKLSSGSFRSRVRSLRFPDLMLYDNRWGAASLLEGQSPDGWLMLGSVVDSERESIHWCGKEVSTQYFACVGESGEFEFNIKDRACDIVLLITPELLRKALGGDAVDLIRQSRQLDFDRAAGAQFLNVVGSMINRLESRSLVLENPALAASARSEILRALEDCFTSHDPHSAETRSLRELAVHVAIEHALNALEQTSAWDMAQAAGVSQKTLETAFRQVLGMTPARYLMLSRLNAAHHQLANGQPEELTVLQVAVEWGFSHSGRFSTAYLQLFGELPSRTLRRSSHHA